MLGSAGRRPAAVVAVAVVLLSGATLAGCSGGGSGGSSAATSAPDGGGKGGAGGGGGGSSGGGGGGGGGSDAPAKVPATEHAAIYNLFGASPGDRTLLATLTRRLENEGYDVTRYEDRTEGAGGRGSGTLANFAKLPAKAGVIIVNAHGEDFETPSQSCSADSKGFGRCTTAETIPSTGSTTTGPKSTTPPTAPRSTKVQPVLQVEWYPTWKAEQRAYDAYVAAGWDPDWLYDPAADGQPIPAGTLIRARPGDQVLRGTDGKGQNRGQGYRPWLGITADGIDHVFHGHDVRFVDDMSCHSLAMAPSFDATSVVAHSSTACREFQEKDDVLLFDRLVGKQGVDRREVGAAMDAGGFVDQHFELWDGSQPVVLSPAVERLDPAEGAAVKPGTTTKASVRFDAEMDRSATDGVVTVEGCDATITAPTWKGRDELAFGIDVPDDPSSRSMTLTIHHGTAQGDPGGHPNQELDGNGDPDGKDGVAPNRDDETWHLSCGNQAKGGVTVRSAGTFHSTYTRAGYTLTTDFTWDEQRTTAVSFKDGAFSSTPQGDGTLTASGSSVSTGSEVGANSDCHWTAAKGAVLPVIISTGRADTTVQPERRTIDIVAQWPGSANVQGRTDGQLVESGVCDQQTSGGPRPFDLVNPPGGIFDPGSKLQALKAGIVSGIDVDALKRKPKVVTFPVSYALDDAAGGHLVVRAKATVTVSLS